MPGESSSHERPEGLARGVFAPPVSARTGSLPDMACADARDPCILTGAGLLPEAQGHGLERHRRARTRGQTENVAVTWTRG